MLFMNILNVNIYKIGLIRASIFLFVFVLSYIRKKKEVT